MAGEVYRFLLRMPTHLRERLIDATNESGKSLNSEIDDRLEQSLADDPGVVRRLGLRISGAWTAPGERITREGGSMSPRNKNPRRATRRRRVAIGVAAVGVLLTAAVVAAALTLNPSKQAAAPVADADAFESRRSRKKLAAAAKFAPARRGSKASKRRPTERWTGDALDAGSRRPAGRDQRQPEDSRCLKGRGGDPRSSGRWTALGPDNAVYPRTSSGTGCLRAEQSSAAGRTAHSVIDPDCRPRDCRYWIANAGGGIWMTKDAFASRPRWENLSEGFGHNNTAALELDPNDGRDNTLYAGTGEPNTCRSGCIAGIGMYKSKDGGEHWKGPIGAELLQRPRHRLDPGQGGDPKTIFVGSGAQGSRGISDTCCNGVDRGANIPGAPHSALALHRRR